MSAYLPIDFENLQTPLNEVTMDQLQGGIILANTKADQALASQPPVPVNGQWLKGQGGGMTWAAIQTADVVGLDAALAGKAKLATVGAISAGPPVGPVSGDVWVATDVGGAGSGVRWAFQYNAGSASPYKWEFIGGTKKTSYDNTPQNPLANTPTTYGPAFTVPRSGEYLVTAQGQFAGGAAGNIGIVQPILDAAAVAITGQSALATFAVTALTNDFPATITAGAVLRVSVYVTVAVASSGRLTTIIPVRVS
jgi:hypothetical protein